MGPDSVVSRQAHKHVWLGEGDEAERHNAREEGQAVCAPVPRLPPAVSARLVVRLENRRLYISRSAYSRVLSVCHERSRRVRTWTRVLAAMSDGSRARTASTRARASETIKAATAKLATRHCALSACSFSGTPDHRVCGHAGRRTVAPRAPPLHSHSLSHRQMERGRVRRMSALRSSVLSCAVVHTVNFNTIGLRASRMLCGRETGWAGRGAAQIRRARQQHDSEQAAWHSQMGAAVRSDHPDERQTGPGPAHSLLVYGMQPVSVLAPSIQSPRSEPNGVASGDRGESSFHRKRMRMGGSHSGGDEERASCHVLEPAQDRRRAVCSNPNPTT